MCISGGASGRFVHRMLMTLACKQLLILETTLLGSFSRSLTFLGGHTVHSMG